MSKQLRPKIGVYAIYEPGEEGWHDLEAQLNTAVFGLARQGLEVVVAPAPVCNPASCEQAAAYLSAAQVDLLFALVITWSFDHYTIEIQQACGVPVAIRSLPGIRAGSLVAGQQLNCVLHDLGSEHRLFFGPLEEDAIDSAVADFAFACALRRSLRGQRMLVIGRRTEGMTPTAIDEVEIQRVFGVRLLTFGLDEFLELARREPADEIEAAWERVAGAASQVSASRAHGLIAMRNYLAARRLAAERGAQSIAIGSYPQCQGTMCLPIALLNEDGIPTGCEGDANSTLAMVMLHVLTGLPVHFGEMLDVDQAANELVSSHCGAAAPSLASTSGYLLCPVRLADSGVCIRYCSQPGPITYVNLVGRKGNYRICALEGDAVPTGLVFEGTPLRIRLDVPIERVLQATADGGYGHHWMAGYGRVANRLAEYARLAGLQGVFPGLKPSGADR